MESSLWLQIDKLESKSKRYQRDNEDLRDKNKNLEVIIEIHKIEVKYKEKNISNQKKSYRKIICTNWRIKRWKWFQSKIENQDIKKEINDYEVEKIRLNKFVNNKDEELTHIRQKLIDQESVVDQYQQQIKVLQQQNNNSKKEHKLDIAKSNKIISNNSEEIFRLRNHNKTLIAKIKNWKTTTRGNNPVKTSKENY